MHSSRKYGLLLVFFLICYGTAAFASQFGPGDWYESLQRAPWTPPDLAFPIVWTILYALIAVSGWLLFLQSSRLPKVLWVVQLLLNAAWSWLFFGEHWVGLALFDIVALGLVLAILIPVAIAQGQRAAGFMLVPYLVWIALASSLNAYVVLYN